ncbi:FecR family protein [Litoribacillus peritrichatus]
MTSAPSRETIEQAAQWHSTLHSGEVTEQERSDFERWHDAHPDHQSAYQQLDALWSRFDLMTPDLREPAGSVLNKVLSEEKSRNRLRTPNLVLGFSLVAAYFIGLQSGMFTHLSADYVTAVGERQTISLSDGSQLVLNTNSAVEVQFDAETRRLVLQKGELWVDVSKDPNRPFVVETDTGTARALGTQYSVRETGDAMAVLVTESQVEVCHGQPERLDALSPFCVTTQQGQLTTVQKDRVDGPKAAETLGLTAWKQGRLVVDNWPLEKVLAEVARYRPGVLHYNAGALSGLQVSGVFSLDDTDQALALLSENLPIQVDRYTRYLTVIRKNK